MKILTVEYKENNKEIVGELINADVLKTKIKTSEGEIIEVDSDFVTLKGVKVDEEFSTEWLEALADQYQGCEITEVEKQEIDLAVAFFKNQLKEIKKLKEENARLKQTPGIVVPTLLGKIVATESTDPNYPGIYIEIEDDEGFVQNAVAVEHYKDKNIIKVHTWKQSEEDAIYSYRWNENPLAKLFKPED